MKLSTKHFGDIDIDKNEIIIFDEGLPGFKHLTRFTLLNQDVQDGFVEKNENNNDILLDEIFFWLQSIEDGNIAFVLLNTLKIMPEYEPHIDKDEIECLGEYLVEDLLICNITVIPENMIDMTANLKAPIIINPVTRKGKQVVVLEEEYKIKHFLMGDTTLD